MTILEALDDPELFGPAFPDPRTWTAWRAFLAALFALPMSPAEAACYARHTGRTAPPAAPAREAWVVVGRRGGKSRVAALVAVYLAAFRSYAALLAPGEQGTLPIIAADRRQARTVLRYVRGLLTGVPMPTVVSFWKRILRTRGEQGLSTTAGGLRLPPQPPREGRMADDAACKRSSERRRGHYPAPPPGSEAIPATGPGGPRSRSRPGALSAPGAFEAARRTAAARLVGQLVLHPARLSELRISPAWVPGVAGEILKVLVRLEAPTAPAVDTALGAQGLLTPAWAAVEAWLDCPLSLTELQATLADLERRRVCKLLATTLDALAHEPVPLKDALAGYPCPDAMQHDEVLAVIAWLGARLAMRSSTATMRGGT